jgi:hypothetical protein
VAGGQRAAVRLVAGLLLRRVRCGVVVFDGAAIVRVLSL